VDHPEEHFTINDWLLDLEGKFKFFDHTVLPQRGVSSTVLVNGCFCHKGHVRPPILGVPLTDTFEEVHVGSRETCFWDGLICRPAFDREQHCSEEVLDFFWLECIPPTHRFQDLFA